MRFSACIELLFAVEHPDFPDRIRAAKAAGLDAVEFWRFSNKDLDAVEAALHETGLPLAGILCEPIAPITNPDSHAEFLAGVRTSLAAAQKLGATMLIAQAGDDQHVARTAQHAAIVKVLKDAAKILEGTGVVLALEPLNDRVDHPGYYLTSTEEGLDIVDEVARPEVRLIYDIYHSAVMGERIEDVLRGRVDRVVHAHLADAPGRHEPGTGAMDYVDRLKWLFAQGYNGLVGLEYKPVKPTVEGLGFRENL
ncbi:MAG: hydroxypyruvate isomerase [Acetobacteraceae bacterium]|nr:MAG: hydroxypyruvate isomerase [Acetobacteraceae bacterium]